MMCYREMEVYMINDHFTNKNEKGWSWVGLGVTAMNCFWHWEASEKEELHKIQPFDNCQFKIVIFPIYLLEVATNK